MAITECILGILLGIIFSAFFAGSEAALTAVNKIRLRHLVELGDKRAIETDKFISNEGRFLGTTLVGTNIGVVLASALATKLFANFFGPHNGALISTFIITFIILIFGEIIPKTLFRQSSDSMSLHIIYPLKFVFQLLRPIIWVIDIIKNILFFPFRDKIKKDSDLFMSKKDIELIIATTGSKGMVTHNENVLIQRIFDLGRTTIRKIMMPLSTVALVNMNNSIEQLKELSRKTKFARFPVYVNNITNIVGTVNIYEYFFDNEQKNVVGDYLNKPFFVYQTDHVDDILNIMRKNKINMAVVVNSANVPVGIVTIEDLLEEIVGEIEG